MKAQWSRKFDYRLVIEVESGHSIVGLRLGRLFLNAEYPAAIVEFDHAVALGVIDVIGKDRCPAVMSYVPS